MIAEACHIIFNLCIGSNITYSLHTKKTNQLINIKFLDKKRKIQNCMLYLLLERALDITTQTFLFIHFDSISKFF